MSKVYVVEIPARRNSAGRLMGARDISDAHRFGQLVTLLPSSDEGAQPFDMALACARVVQGLKAFDHAQDFLIAGMGHPLALACAIAAVAQSGHGKLRLLHWDSRRTAYSPVFIDIIDTTKSHDPQSKEKERAA